MNRKSHSSLILVFTLLFHFLLSFEVLLYVLFVVLFGFLVDSWLFSLCMCYMILMVDLLCECFLLCMRYFKIWSIRPQKPMFFFFSVSVSVFIIDVGLGNLLFWGCLLLFLLVLLLYSELLACFENGCGL